MLCLQNFKVWVILPHIFRHRNNLVFFSTFRVWLLASRSITADKIIPFGPIPQETIKIGY